MSEEKESKAPRKPEKPARSKLERRSKKYRDATKLIEKDKEYSAKDALELAIKTSTVKFDATVELHVNLDVDPKQADQNIRGTVTLPSGSGKTVRVAVFVEADKVAEAKKAGADIAGIEEIVKLLDKESMDFDVLISPPTLMSQLGKYARLLGPRGLMPNPKSGTVTTDIKKAITEAKAGRVEYRVDSTGIVHLGIGKVSFGADKLVPNAEAVLGAIRSAKPASLKGNYVKSVYVTSTMGPSVRLSTTI
ncbi:MAG TPA: 50S ribosomal protein L1 [Patescibacteria group bacterium]|nr:50S ribosomal protein L1 [Patescibacteria group bacterium]